MRDIVEPITNERGYETHPSWIAVTVHRGTVSPPGAVLFGSDIRHQHVITVKIHEAERKRDLNHDWVHPDKVIAEFTMAESQWASFVSSMGSGSGTPATLVFREMTATPEQLHVPGMPYDPRLAHSMYEVRDAAKKAQEEVLAAFEAYKEKKTVGNLRHLESTIDNLPSNISFAAKSLTEHTENVVNNAKADIEAFVIDKARQLGLDPADISGPLELMAGDDA